ncbi:beta-lactamase/transpeptidase-like protein [Tribonema minus]|uniref:Beta-lactamase/transpeptidase-like protein n=1 Tax=Tribonema minus TaxID=303371 RepID=A0A835ZC02_9STRA|nr:beta-lactamase/transpeptidase-like protein [Tribonema minus]
MLVAALALAAHQALTHLSFQRRVRTFMVASTIVFSLRATRRRTQGISAAESDEAWESAHKLLAPFLYWSILRLKGLWVKFGQFASSRGDVMPQAFIDELSKLQDSVPASPWREIRKTIESALGARVEDAFGSVSEKALASASVAQVHRGTLHDGTAIVVKAQHADVQRLMLSDLSDIMTIARLVAWADPQYNFKPICEEWTREVRKELDFNFEADNLVCLRRAMADSGLDVKIPELVPQFTRRSLLVMRFCPGFKVTDTTAMERASLDRLAIMEAVCRSFAYQVHILGRFNGDPHPGNILIETFTDEAGCPSARPVLLDWGLAKQLPEHLRLAFSKFVYAASEMDVVNMLESLDDMGMVLNRFDPMEDMTNIRFMMRDTAPPDEAKAETQVFKKVMIKRYQAGKRNPMEAYPGDLLFFMRVTQLLHGLGSRLHVRAKYMDFMAPEAQRALRESVPRAAWASALIYASPALSPLETKVRALLRALHDEGELNGCQVCVFRHGACLVDTCAGAQGPIDPRPVTPDTLFPAFSVTKVVAAAALHALIDRGAAALDTPLASFWPAFAKRGKGATTLRHVLTHATGLQHALPRDANLRVLCDWRAVLAALEDAAPVWPPGTRSAYHYFNFGFLAGACVEKLSGMPFGEFVRTEIAAPLGLSAHMFIGGVAAAGVPRSRIAAVEMAAFKEAFGSADQGEIGDVMREEEEAEEEEGAEGGAEGGVRAGKGGGRGFLHLMAEAIKEEDPQEGAALEELADKLRRREYLLDPRIFNSKDVQEACIPSANGLFTARALATLHNDFLLSLGAVDAAAAASDTSASTPAAANGGRHAHSAGGGAAFAGVNGTAAAAAQRGGLLSRERVEEFRSYAASDSSAMHRLFGLRNRMRYGLGCQLFGFKEEGPEGARRTRLSGFGTTSRSRTHSLTHSFTDSHTHSAAPLSHTPCARHVGVGGSAALCDPATGVSFAMTVNRIRPGRRATTQVFELVCKELGMGEPVPLFANS